MSRLLCSFAVMFLAAALAMGVATEALATTYLYSDLAKTNFYSNGDYLTASADLDCAEPCAAGSYRSSSSTLISFSISLFSSANLSIFSLTSGSPDTYAFGGEYVTLDDAGRATDWNLRLINSTIGIYAFTFNCSDCGVQDHAQGSSVLFGNSNNPGTWQIASVPLHPSTWSTMILGFAAFGFIAYRRRIHAVAHAA